MAKFLRPCVCFEYSCLVNLPCPCSFHSILWTCKGKIQKPHEILLKSVLIDQQISSFRESKSDDRRFYIFTATKTLHLRSGSKRDREAWIQALVSTRSLFSLRAVNDSLSIVPNDLSVSTERLKQRLVEEGVGDCLVNECEQIMLSEFSQIHVQLKLICQERSNLLDTLRQLEVTIFAFSIAFHFRFINVLLLLGS